MQIVNRISFPKSSEVANLYLQFQQGASFDYSDAPEIVFNQGGIVTTNSYFNSIYENFYNKYTSLDSLYYQLRLEGDFKISIYRESAEKSRELISTEKLDNCQATEFVSFKLPKLEQGRIYFEIECLSDRGVFKEGVIVTEQNPIREVSLAIISCTYKKEEYIKKTVDTIVRDPLLQTKSWKIFVVDNGETLSTKDFTDSRVQLIPNRNVGGSGGFTRGLVEALQSDGYTHFLFMDDDIELDSESIYRLFSLYEYAPEDFAVAGSMLDLIKKHVLYEAGALYGKDNQTLKTSPFSVALRKHNLELENPESLNLLLLDEYIDYGGFWFFAFSRKVVEKIGLPLPYFIKVDDMEFCVRITKLGGKIVAFPSIGVWHEPFYNKVIVWDSYYYVRNNLITHSVYGTINYINTIFTFTRDLIFSLLIFEYNYAALIVRAFEDYLKGPSVLKSNNPEVLHKEILALTKSYKTQSIKQNYSPPKEVYPTKDRASFGKKLISLLTINGHLLPNFLDSDGEVFMWQTSEHSGLRSRAFRKKRVLIYREDNNCLFQNEFDKAVGIDLLTRWVKAVITISFKGPSAIAQWKAAYSEFTSIKFWQQYLGLKDRANSKVEA